jgi:serine/threonine protein kinase
MSPERWERIKDVAFSAMEREGDSRARFVEEACGTDSDLRRAVEELIEEHQRPGDSLARAIGSVAADVPTPDGHAQTGSSMVGQTISHYKITEKLGQGGMGVVYKAEDTKLHRSVALKFLAPPLLRDPEARKRFEREAAAAASLDHPNICTVYEIDEVDGQTFIAMAFVEGQTVKEKLRQRPFKLDEALDIAIQAAQGLQAAHEKGIVHRDIKSANLMLNTQGQVKIMDFGLAQLADHSRLTRTATSPGTPAYMSPEQAECRPTDRRTDLWSLGVVLYEMVTGRLPFEGERQQAVLHAIVNTEPEPITALRFGVPLELDWIAGKCLTKDADRRYQTAVELSVDLENLQEKVESGRPTTVKTPVGAPHAVPLLPKWKLYLPWAVAAVTMLALAALAFVHIREVRPPELPLRRFSYAPPALIAAFSVTADHFRANLAISPDGRHIAFSTSGPNNGRQLWVQDLDRPQPRLISADDSAAAPFWSPDSNQIGFATVPGGPGELRRVSVHGGPSSRVCELPGQFLGGTWSPDGEIIVFSALVDGFGLLHEVPSGGGAAKPLTGQQGAAGLTGQREDRNSPHFLPPEAGPRVLLYADAGLGSDSTLVAHDLSSGRREMLGSGTLPVYSPSGHLVFQATAFGQDILAAPFSLKSLQVTGERFPLRQGARYPSVARDGTLALLERSASPMQQMVWRDRHGAKIGTIGQPQMFLRKPELSPDGRRVLVLSNESGNADIWVHDIGRGVRQRLTFDPAPEDQAIWLPTGDRVSFASARRHGGGGADIYVQSADGNGEAQPLVASPAGEWNNDWTADEKYMIFVHGRTNLNLYYLKRKDDRSGYDLVPFITGSLNIVSSKLSPGGSHVAYESNESGRFEIYVQSFPGGGGKLQVSESGGRQPRWRRDGKELFYVKGTDVYAVPVTMAGGFSAGRPKRLFEAHPVSGTFERPGHQYTVTPDGQKFIIVEYAEGEAAAPTIQVVQNWFAEFK